MKTLTPGGNTNLQSNVFQIKHNILSKADVSAFLLGSDGKVLNDEGMVFYGSTKSNCGTISLQNNLVNVDLNKIPSSIDKIVITATMHSGDFSLHDNIEINSIDFDVKFNTSEKKETAITLFEIYKRNGSWKIRYVEQGFYGGLKPLAEGFGVDIADEPTEQPAPKPKTPAKKVSLSKISLTKENPKISLEKKSDNLGLIKVNLKWSKKTKGFFSSNIDLDLGAYVEFKNGEKTIVQAIGNNLNLLPYLKVLKDDRSGDSGEWMHIYGEHIAEIKRITIFTYIYEGTPNWASANASVTIYVPGMPEIETLLDNSKSGSGFAAIAHFDVNNGGVDVTRINKYFKGHADCDRHFNWGFSWRAGSK